MRKQMAKCSNGHEIYHSRAAAERALADLIAHAKQTGQGGTSWKRLNVFPCGNHYHVGRANQPHRPPKPVPTEKPMTVGQARRALARLDRAMDRHTDWYHRRMAEILGRVIAADR
jgi:hypothetical protein